MSSSLERGYIVLALSPGLAAPASAQVPAESDGPFFCVPLPSGSYTVHAMFAGAARVEPPTIAPRGATVAHLCWDDPEA